MFQSAPRRTLPSGARSTKPSRTVCIIDPRPEDYLGWAEFAHARGLELTFVATAGEALRRARSGHVALWVINADLPDLGGHELCGMLRAQSPAAPIYIVADQYTPASEIAALRSRATLYGCKGSHSDWLRQWAEQFAQRASSTPAQTALQPVQ